MIFISI